MEWPMNPSIVPLSFHLFPLTTFIIRFVSRNMQGMMWGLFSGDILMSSATRATVLRSASVPRIVLLRLRAELQWEA